MTDINDAFELIYKKNNNIIRMIKCPKCKEANKSFWDGSNFECHCGFGSSANYIKEKYNIDILELIDVPKIK